MGVGMIYGMIIVIHKGSLVTDLILEQFFLLAAILQLVFLLMVFGNGNSSIYGSKAFTSQVSASSYLWRRHLGMDLSKNCNAVVMPKHAFFFWLAIQYRLPACDRLAKWGWQGNLLWGFCSTSRDHIFFESSFSSRNFLAASNVGMFMIAGAWSLVCNYWLMKAFHKLKYRI